MRRVLAVLILAAFGAASAQAAFFIARSAPPAPPPAVFYVSPSGSDSATGGSSDPLLTIAKARDAMRASGSIKTAYLLPGTYSLSAVVQLTSADNGVLIAGAPGQAWSAAVIDGGSTLESAFCLRGTNNSTITNLKIANVQYGGVMIHGGASFGPNTCTTGATVAEAGGNTVSNIEVTNITVPNSARYADTGGVLAQGDVPNTVVTQILVTDSNGMCVRGSADGGTDDLSGFTVQNSVFLRCLKQNGDGGVIYTQDYTGASKSILVTNNYIKDYGNSSAQNNRCFYGDASSSQVTFTRNICGNPGAWGVDGDASVIFLCGKNNIVSQNVFDLGSTGKQIIYQYGGCGAPATTTAMTGNTFTQNVLVASFSGTQATSWAGWTGSESYYSGGAQAAYPAITSNVYWSYGGGTISAAGVVMPGESSPIRSNPLCSGGMAYNIGVGSPAFTAGYVAPARGWGPTGYVLPTYGGAASSCPA